MRIKNLAFWAIIFGIIIFGARDLQAAPVEPTNLNIEQPCPTCKPGVNLNVEKAPASKEEIEDKGDKVDQTMPAK